MTPPIHSRVRIGISACMLGEKVRFDGGHRKDEFLTDHFGRFVEWVPVCPEFEIGLGVPRESLRLVDKSKGVQLIAQRSGADHSEAMRRFARERAGIIADQGLCGFVFKRNSPSCGLERVKVYRDAGLPHRDGRGLFAEGLCEHLPYLPVEEEGRLNDSRLRENFVSQVFTFKRWMDFGKAGLTRRRIMEFHASHKFLLMAHSQDGMRRLGNVLGRDGKSTPVNQLGEKYFKSLCGVMRHAPTRRNHTNVLQHLAGFISDRLDSVDRAELAGVIDRYRRELLPLIVPMTLIRHYVRKFGVEFLKDQVYLDPHPDELKLLNHL